MGVLSFRNVYILFLRIVYMYQSNQPRDTLNLF